MKTALTPEKRRLCTRNPRDLGDKLARYVNSLPLHHDDGIDHAFCEEELDALFNLLDQVEASLPEYPILENTELLTWLAKE